MPVLKTSPVGRTLPTAKLNLIDYENETPQGFGNKRKLQTK